MCISAGSLAELMSAGAEIFLLDVVAGELLAEAGGGAVLVLGLVQAGHSSIQGGAGHQILLPGDLIGGMGLSLIHI